MLPGIKMMLEGLMRSLPLAELVTLNDELNSTINTRLTARALQHQMVELMKLYNQHCPNVPWLVEGIAAHGAKIAIDVARRLDWENSIID